MNTELKLFARTSLEPEGDLVDKVSWASDDVGKPNPSDINVQDNFDSVRDLIADGLYIPYPAHVNHDDTVPFEFLPDADAKALAEQQAEIAKVRAEGKVPFHYIVTYTMYGEAGKGRNPNRKRSKLSRGRSRANIAG